MAIEEELELNIEKALEAIDQFAKTFEQAIAAFSSVLADALTQVFSSSQTIQAQLDIDPGNSGEVVQDAIGEEQTTSVTFEDTNASDVGAEVQSELSSTTPDPLSIPLEGEDAGLSATVEEAVSDPEVPDIVLPVDADTSKAETEAQALLDFLDALQANLDIEVDTTEVDAAQAAVDALAASEPIDLPIGGEDAKGIEEVEKSLTKVNEAVPVAALSLSDLKGTLGLLTVAASAAATAIAAGAAAAATLFSAAVGAESASRSFNASLGALAPSILNIEANGLSIDLRQLAQDLGSSDEAALGVAQRFGQLGLTSGATTERISGANSQLFAVAANLRSINPALGTLDEVATKAGQAFIRGGRSAAALGINLTSGEIRARAYIDTQKETNEQLSQFELFAAGAALASERFGDSIKNNVDLALDDPTIRLMRIKEVFGDFVEELGKPLISPVFQALDTGLPVVLAFTSLFADLASSVMPGVQSVIEELAPIFLNFAETVTESVNRLKPAFESGGEAVAVLAAAFANVAFAATEPLLAILEGYAFVLKTLADVVVEAGEGTTTFALALFGLYKIWKIVDVALKTNAFGLIVSGIALAASALVGFANRSEESTSTFSELSEEIFANVESIDGLTDAIRRYLAEIEDFVVKSRILKDTDLVSNLNDAAISAETLSFWVNSGRDGLEGLAQILLNEFEPGVRISNTQVKAMQEGLDSLSDEELINLLTTLDEYEPELSSIGTALVDLQGELNRTSKAKFEELVVTGQLSNAEKERILTTIAAEGAESDYTRALELGNEVLGGRAKNEADAAEAYKNSAKAQLDYLAGYNKIIGEVALGVATAESFEDALSRVGLEVEDSAALFEEMSTKFAEFSQVVASNVPSLIDAFSRLGEEGINSDIILDEFEKSIEATNEWSNNLIKYASENNTALLQIAAELGPERTRLLIDGYTGSEAELNEHLERMLLLELNARAEAEVAAKIGFLEQRGLYAGEYEALAQLLRDKAFFGPLTRADLDAALVELQTAIPGLETGGVAAGTAIGEGTMQGVEEGYARGASPAQEALRRAIAAAQGGGEEAAATAGRETGLAIGTATTEGLTQGLGPVTGVLVSNLLQSGFVAVANAGPVGAQIGNTVLDNWRNTLFARSGEIVRGVGAVVTGTASGNVGTAREAGGLIALETNSGFSQRIQDSAVIPLLALRVMLSNVAEASTETAYNAGYGLGESLMDGLASGIAQNIGRATEAAARAVREAEDAARLEAESDSPSRAWERLGRDLVAGLSRGLDGASGLASRSAAGVLGSANSAAGSVSNSNISVTVPVTINGNADPSVGRQIGQIAAAELRSVLRLEARVS